MEKEKTYGVWAVRSAASIFGKAEAWCKEDGRPIEFDTPAAAEAYAKDLNSRTTANVHYSAREKEPEPGAVRKAASQQDLDARSLGGRQIMPESDPMVAIRSAVHSNYAGMTTATAPFFL